MNSQYIIKKLKEWALLNYGAPEESVNVFSVNRLSNGYWNARCSFIYNNEEKRFSVSLDSNGEIVSYSDLSKTGSGDMGSAPTMILIAEVFSIIALIGLVLSLVAVLIAGTASITNVTPAGTTTVSAFSSVIGIIVVAVVIMLVISVYILSRILKIRKYILAGDAVSALSEDSVGLGVLALIFNGIIAGILLLLARDDLRRASQ
ncbi:hypothetical protein [Thermoplasma sp.]|uniref:hypothetical protein n=1 Tax=Thermoplasma sp. TaxID=1973142 RepID=UPI0025E09B7B|nr:hypothetical protein [Thermoplasma sp.]